MLSITRTTPSGTPANDVMTFRRGYQSGSDIRKGTARVNKSKTLDGAVVILHNGFVEGDRNMRIKAQVTEAERAVLWSIFSTQTFVNIAFEEGVFNGVIQTLNDDGGQVSMGIEFKEKLTS